LKTIRRSGNIDYKGENGIERRDCPAGLLENGLAVWFVEDHMHREDGPAALWPHGHAQWLSMGKEIRSNLSAENSQYLLMALLSRDAAREIDAVREMRSTREENLDLFSRLFRSWAKPGWA
jgi:hypothetical protein